MVKMNVSYIIHYRPSKYKITKRPDSSNATTPKLFLENHTFYPYRIQEQTILTIWSSLKLTVCPGSNIYYSISYFNQTQLVIVTIYKIYTPRAYILYSFNKIIENIKPFTNYTFTRK